MWFSRRWKGEKATRQAQLKKGLHAAVLKVFQRINWSDVSRSLMMMNASRLTWKVSVRWAGGLLHAFSSFSTHQPPQQPPSSLRRRTSFRADPQPRRLREKSQLKTCLHATVLKVFQRIRNVFWMFLSSDTMSYAAWTPRFTWHMCKVWQAWTSSLGGSWSGCELEDQSW